MQIKYLYTKMKYSNRISFPYGYINIHSDNYEFLCHNVLHNSNYQNKISSIEFNIIFGIEKIDNDTTYRGKQFIEKGLYLGHHIGKKAKLKIINNTISVYILNGNKSDYEKVFWNFILKYILTYCSLITNSLHFKGVLLKNVKSKKGLVILGKGGDGKTCLGKELQKHGYKILSNTHIIIDFDKVYGMNTWVRERRNDKDIYINKEEITTLDCKLEKIFIYQFNEKGLYLRKKMASEDAYVFLNYFSNALINYDLKEEVFDYMANKFIDSIKLLSSNDKLLKNIIEEYNIDFLSLDIQNKNTIELFIKDI